MTTHFAHAVEKGIDSQPRKVSVVASLARDRYVSDAVVILENTPRRAARAVRKAIESAAANLLNNSDVSIDPKTIRVARISVTAGTRMCRYVPASRGRALPFEKISSNIFVEVAGEEKVKRGMSREEKNDSSSAEAKPSVLKTKSSDKTASKPASTKKVEKEDNKENK